MWPIWARENFYWGVPTKTLHLSARGPETVSNAMLLDTIDVKRHLIPSNGFSRVHKLDRRTYGRKDDATVTSAATGRIAERIHRWRNNSNNNLEFEADAADVTTVRSLTQLVLNAAVRRR